MSIGKQMSRRLERLERVSKPAVEDGLIVVEFISSPDRQVVRTLTIPVSGVRKAIGKR
jgi:hypothetical protein